MPNTQVSARATGKAGILLDGGHQGLLDGILGQRIVPELESCEGEQSWSDRRQSIHARKWRRQGVIGFGESIVSHIMQAPLLGHCPRRLILPRAIPLSR